MSYQLPPLPYDYNALEPYIDEQTMRLHHTKHHQGYVDKLNQALEKYPAGQEKSLEELLRNLGQLPTDIQTAVRNNGGGHYNHSLFWQIMSPDRQPPSEKLRQLISEQFGGWDSFQEEFTKAALARFGSGWAWLYVTEEKKLAIASTANQDNPLMGQTFSGLTGQPVLGLDVWEHAYYLKYQNRRAEYIENWWQVVNWVEVEKRLTEQLG